MAGTHDHTSENNMSDQSEGCESSAMLSRRGFLKGIGALAVGAVAAKAAIAPEVAEAARQKRRVFDRAVGIALSSKLVQQAVRELRRRGFDIDLQRGFNQDTLLRSDLTPHLVGIVTAPLEDLQRNQSSTGIIVTVDMTAGNVFGVTYNIVDGNITPTEIESVIISRDNARVEKRRTVKLSDEDQVDLNPTSGRDQQISPSALEDCTCGGQRVTAICCSHGQCFGGYQCTHLVAYRFDSCTKEVCSSSCMYVGCP